MFRPKKIGPRAEHRDREAQRVRDSLTLADRFRKLKALTVDLSFFDAGGLTKNRSLKYTVNLANAKSVFRFNCPNPECVAGDFDLTDVLAAAVARRRVRVTGETVCPGWQNRTTIQTSPCKNLLRYTLTLTY